MEKLREVRPKRAALQDRNPRATGHAGAAERRARRDEHGDQLRRDRAGRDLRRRPRVGNVGRARLRRAAWGDDEGSQDVARADENGSASDAARRSRRAVSIRTAASRQPHRREERALETIALRPKTSDVT